MKVFIPTTCVDQMVDLVKEPMGAYIMLHYVDDEGLKEIYIPYTIKLLELGGLKCSNTK